MRTPQVRAPSYLAAGFDEWGGLGWALRRIGGVQVIEHGGSLNGFQAKLKLVPARRFAIAVLTNSARGGVLGDRVAEWAFDHFLGLRAPRHEPVALPDDALATFAGRYRSSGEEATLTVEDGGLRCVVHRSRLRRRTELTYPANLLRPVAEREFVVVTAGVTEGARVDFIEGDDGAIRFLRMDGRLYDRVRDATEA